MIQIYTESRFRANQMRPAVIIEAVHNLTLTARETQLEFLSKMKRRSDFEEKVETAKLLREARDTLAGAPGTLYSRCTRALQVRNLRDFE